MKKNNLLYLLVKILSCTILGIGLIYTVFGGADNNSGLLVKPYSNENTFKIISSSENKELDKVIKEYGIKNNVDIEIDYAGTLEIMENLNYGKEYDAVWCSNSIWLYMLDSSVKISDSKSTSIEPVIFAITKSKAEELGLTDREIYTDDIISAIDSGDLKFSMSNPTRTNTGATAYLGLLTNLAGSPEVLREEYLEDENLKERLVTLFSGLERSSGEEDFLEEIFLEGNYDSVVTYESSIIKMNKKLEEQGKEPLYALYPKDGVSISDSPLAYIDRGIDNKKQIFKNFQSYILSEDGQKILEQYGRRTWYGGQNNNVDKTVFNPNWGINTTSYISTVKYPSTTVIKKALALYQSELRKPTHVVFCLDYSGSMIGDGNEQLVNAMKYILDEEKASKDLLQFSEKDKITIIPFGTKVMDILQVENGNNASELISEIVKLSPKGSTALYPSCQSALKILKDEDLDIYNTSVIVMTDGEGNRGTFKSLSDDYYKINKDIPIYSIMFGDAKQSELEDIARLTNAKVFDGRTNLLEAFKEVRGYN